MRYALFAVALFTLTGIAQADILAGGPIYGGSSQVAAICYVYNTGSTALTLGPPPYQRSERDRVIAGYQPLHGDTFGTRWMHLGD
jgi:hypothetical protein